MQQLITEKRENWLQLYVDAMTERKPYKRLALVRQLREIPRHDESEDSLPRTGLQLVPNRKPATAKLQAQRAGNHKTKPAGKSGPHLVRSRKGKPAAKASRRSARLRSA